MRSNHTDLFHECLEELFQQALEIDEEARAAFLDEACRGDEAMRNAVVELLRASARAEQNTHWNEPAIVHEARSTASRNDAAALERYRLLERVGTGGMGVVYKAVRADDAFSKLVAVKIVHDGATGETDDEGGPRRFRQERQILAGLEHPNIARLLDGGSTDHGQPFLVMEYVDGVPIDQYVQERKPPLAELLRLFRKICSAVSYAHRCLVVHRDLKPGNILVTCDGEPKLLDFGIAKLLHEPAARTNTGAMTPEYASPEQVRGEPITTASDIYSLGVLLYELLSGRRPHSHAAGAMELARAIGTEAAEPLTARDGKRFDADIENIVRMAMRKEPERRYASVEQFSEDMRRYIEGYPVAARPDTRWYRWKKFVGRNKIPVLAMTLFVLTLLGGIAATARQAHLANRRFNDVRKLANSVLFEFYDSIQGIPGTLAARQLFVKRALQYLDSLASEAGGDKSLRKELSVAYDRVGSLTFDVRSALDAHRKALAINESLSNSEPSNKSYRQQLSLSYGFVANALKEMGDSPASLEHFRTSAAILESLTAADPNKQEYRFNLAEAYDWVGIMLARLGQDDSASKYHFKALALRGPLVEADPGNIEYRRALMTSYLYIADRLTAQNNDRKALDYIHLASQISEALTAAHPAHVAYRRDSWLVNERLARSLDHFGDSAGALEIYRQALTLIEQLSRSDPGDQGNRRCLAATYLAFAQLLDKMHRTGDALVRFDKAIELSRALLAADPSKTEARLDLASAYSHRGNLFLNAGDLTKAADDLNAARLGFEAESRRDPKNVEIQRAEAEVDANLGRLRARTRLATRS